MAGVADPTTIDLIGESAEGEVVLFMVEDRAWGSDPAQSQQLRDKLDLYARFILDGGLATRFPETSGQPLAVQLDCVDEPTGQFAELVEQARAELAKSGVGLRVNARGEA